MTRRKDSHQHDRHRQRCAAETPIHDAPWRRRFRRALLGWFARRARDLPWRRTRDPYAVWVSEIMLQQTQVATVGPYFERFLAAFPNIPALAAADEEEVLRRWEGLGYYRRARQVHRAAGIIAREHGGRFPREPAAVRALPGIGRYTAGAILSIAFDAREPILEANSRRVLCRVLAYRGDPARRAGERLLWAAAETLLPRKNAGAFNQAVMELGSEVCTSGSPDCDACPVKTLCRACESGLQDMIPAPKKKTRYENVREAAVVVRRRGKVLVRRCTAGERWAGLWDFPRFAAKARRGDAVRRELVENVRRLAGVVVEPTGTLTTIKHSVTRFRITLTCHEAKYVSGAAQNSGGGPIRWIEPAALDRLPLGATARKIAGLLV